MQVVCRPDDENARWKVLQKGIFAEQIAHPRPHCASYDLPPRIALMRLSTFSWRSGKFVASQFSNSALSPCGKRTIVKPAEVAPAYLFLANETDSSFITGQVIHVNGGQRNDQLNRGH